MGRQDPLFDQCSFQVLLLQHEYGIFQMPLSDRKLRMRTLETVSPGRTISARFLHLAVDPPAELFFSQVIKGE